jgi:hypothetical protein
MRLSVPKLGRGMSGPFGSKISQCDGGVPWGFCSGAARMRQHFLPQLEQRRRFSTVWWRIPAPHMRQEIRVDATIRASTPNTSKITGTGRIHRTLEQH